MSRISNLALGAALCAAFAIPSALQAHQQTYPGYTAPKTSFGQPEIGGYWTNATLTPTMREARFGDRLVYTEDEVKKLEEGEVEAVARGNESTDPNAPPPKLGGEYVKDVKPEFAAAGGAVGGYNRGWLDPGSKVMRVLGQPRTSLITTETGRPPKPINGVVAPQRPLPAEGEQGADQTAMLGSFDNPENRSLGERCIIGFGRNAGPPMLPNGFYNNDYRIVQTPDRVTIEVEMVHDVRTIRLNSEHRTDGIRPWFGDSIGHWDDNTLVVETTNFPKEEALYGSWKNLKVTERFTRVANDRLLYQFTVEDPDTWAKPWGGEYEFSPMKGIIYEYACHEGNYALEGMLAGARQAELEAAGKALPQSALADPTGRAN